MDSRTEYDKLIAVELAQYKSQLAVEFEKYYREIHHQDFYDLMQKTVKTSDDALGFWRILGYENSLLAKNIVTQLNQGNILSESRIDAPVPAPVAPESAPAASTTSIFNYLYSYLPDLRSLVFSNKTNENVEPIKLEQPKVILNSLIELLDSPTFKWNIDSPKVQLMYALIKQLPSYNHKVTLKPHELYEILARIKLVQRDHKALDIVAVDRKIQKQTVLVADNNIGARGNNPAALFTPPKKDYKNDSLKKEGVSYREALAGTGLTKR